MNTFQIECPNCGRKFTINEKIVGRKVVCSNEACGTKFMAEPNQSAARIEKNTFTEVNGLPSTSQSVETTSPPVLFSFDSRSTASMNSSQQDALIAETRLFRKRMMILTIIAAVPGILLVIGLAVGGYFYAAASMKSQEIERAFRKDANTFLVKARLAVAAWPNSPETFVELEHELANRFQLLPDLKDNQLLHEQREQLREIGICFAFPSVFISRKASTTADIEQDLRSDNKFIREHTIERKKSFAEESHRMDDSVLGALRLIEAAELKLAK